MKNVRTSKQDGIDYDRPSLPETMTRSLGVGVEGTAVLQKSLCLKSAENC